MQHLEGGNRKKVIPEDTNPTTLPKEIIAKDKKKYQEDLTNYI